MTSFISVCFSGRVNLKQIEEKMVLGGLGYALSEIFEISHGVMAFIVLYKQVLIKLFAPHSESVKS